jgi:uncharacterized protein YcbK (DUF882 family)
LTNPRACSAMSRFVSLFGAIGVIGLSASIFVPSITQTAVANGDTRTLSFVHAHRKDAITVTFRVGGSYDQAALQKLNHFMRDWRNDAQIKMDPRLFDVIWEAHRSVGASGPVLVLSSYRSPNTNAMLRRRSRAVANNSQHMFGRAMDIRFQGVNMYRVREIAVKMQRGGVGWYNGSNFVHLDVGSVRTWPRMSYDQLARLFPDGKSVHIAADGRTLPRYEEARSIVAARTGSYVPTLAQTREKSFLARLFGWDEGDEVDQTQARTARSAPQPAARATGAVVAATQQPITSPEENNPATFFRNDARRFQPAVEVAAAPAVPAPAQTARGRRAAPVAVAAAAEPAKLELRAPLPPTRPGEAPQPQAPAAIEAEKTVAPTTRLAFAPLPPRRPSQAQIEAVIARAMPDVPLPPQRPSELIAVAEAKTAAETVPQPTRREQVAALIGAQSAGAVARAGKLPDIITRGAPIAAHAGAAPMAYAPEILQGNAPVRKITPRRAGKALPSLPRAVGMREAQNGKDSLLAAARLDRSNFAAMTAPQSLVKSKPAAGVAPAIAPLRAAVRHDPSRLLFAPADAPAAGFTLTANAWNADRFGPVRVQQAGRLPRGVN